jgi:hypothetical protein
MIQERATPTRFTTGGISMLGSRSRFRVPHLALAVCLTVAVALGASACGSGGNETAADETRAAAGSGEVVSVLRDLGAGMDYTTHSSPGELGARATLTVVGEVIAVDDGRVFGVGPTRDTEPVFLNVTLTVRVDGVLAGDKALARDGVVYVEVSRTKVTSVESFRRATPANQRVILFLGDYSEGPGTFPLIEKAPSIPDGATIFASYADGFLLEDRASGEVVGGFDSLELMAPAWRKGIDSVESFIATHFPAA